MSAGVTLPISRSEGVLVVYSSISSGMICSWFLINSLLMGVNSYTRSKVTMCCSATMLCYEDLLQAVPLTSETADKWEEKMCLGW